MKATFGVKGSINGNHRKNDKFREEYIVLGWIIDSEISEIVRCRLYATDTRWYCCLWVSLNDCYTSGSDYAGGYGYHKPSAAVQGAISAAGFVLNHENGKCANISGVGETAIVEALQAIADIRGFKNTHIIHAHG